MSLHDGDDQRIKSMLSFKNFETRKRKALRKLELALRQEKVDREIITLIELINSFSQWFTTSSCAGRLALLSKDGIRSKYGTTFWFKTHDPNDFPRVKEKLPSEFQGQLWLLVSPPMFHVAARTMEDALQLQLLARQARLGYSKIQSIKPSIIVEVLGTGMMSIPVGKDGMLLVNEDHLDYILELGRMMLSEDQRRMWKWHDLLRALK